MFLLLVQYTTSKEGFLNAENLQQKVRVTILVHIGKMLGEKKKKYHHKALDYISSYRTLIKGDVTNGLVRNYCLCCSAVLPDKRKNLTRAIAVRYESSNIFPAMPTPSSSRESMRLMPTFSEMTLKNSFKHKKRDLMYPFLVC